jgi:hypothetical protein
LKNSTSIDTPAILERSRAAYDQGVKDGLKRHYARTYPGQLGERYMEGYAQGQKERAAKEEADRTALLQDPTVIKMLESADKLHQAIQREVAKRAN